MGDLSKNFWRHEFACRGGAPDGGHPGEDCGTDTMDAELIRVLEDVRGHFNQFSEERLGISINSGCRCPAHNLNEGGSEGSQHLYGKACDFRMNGVPADAVADYLEKKYPDRYGIGRYHGRTHLDVRSGGPARWDRRVS